MVRLHSRLAFCTAILLLVNLHTGYGACPAHGQTQPTGEKLRSYHKIEQAILKGEIDAARKQLSKIIEANPKDGRAWLLLGNIHEKCGDLDQAMVAYCQASRLKDPDATAAMLVIMTSRIRPMLKQAEADLAASERKLVPAPGEKLRSYHKIEQAILKGEIDAARKQLSKIIEANPKDGRAWLLLGNIHEKRGDMHQAVFAYRQASYLKGPDASAALHAIMRPMLKQAEADLAATERKLVPAPGEKLRSYHKIEQAILKGEIDAARKQLSKIIEGNPKDGRTWLLLGNIHEKRGNMDQAVFAYRQASYLKDPDAMAALHAIMRRMLKQAEADLAASERKLVPAPGLYPDAKIWHRQEMGDFTYPNGELIKGPL